MHGGDDRMQGKKLDDAYFLARRTAARRARRGRNFLLLLIACLLGAGICSGGERFHNGGMGSCGGCHSKPRKGDGTAFVSFSSLSGNSMLNDRGCLQAFIISPVDAA